MLWHLLFVVGLIGAEANQLDLLINYVKKNGPNPGLSGSARQAAARPAAPAAPRQAAPSSRNRAAAPIAAPIPFAALADPSLRVVDIDVPQPKQSQFNSQPQQPRFQQQQQQLVARAPPPPETPQFRGLPFGATQIGGSTVLPLRRRVAPAPLNEVEAPIFLNTQFPNPLNDVDPARAPINRPVEAFRHTLEPGRVPRPVQVQSNRLPQLAVLNHRNSQRLANNNQLNYDRFANNVFQDRTGIIPESQQRNGQHQPQEEKPHLSKEQSDEAHKLALEKHFSEVDKVARLQQQVLQQHQQLEQLQPKLPKTKFQQQQFQPQQQFQQQQFQQQQQIQPQQQTQFQHAKINIPEGHFDLPKHTHQPQQQHQQPQQQHHQQQQPAQQPQTQDSRFAIPGLQAHQQYAAELASAQQALLALGR